MLYYGNWDPNKLTHDAENSIYSSW